MVFVQVGKHIFITRSECAAGAGAVLSVESHQNSSHTTGVSAGILGAETLSDLKYFTSHRLDVLASVLSYTIE